MSSSFRIFAGKPRSPRWQSVRKSFLIENPFCLACGEAKQDKLEVHHIHPYHLPGGEDKELDWSNLVTLCTRCHFIFGHLLSWKSWNPDVIMDARRYYRKVETRPGMDPH